MYLVVSSSSRNRSIAPLFNRNNILFVIVFFIYILLDTLLDLDYGNLIIPVKKFFFFVGG